MIPLEVTDPIERAARLRSLRIAARILCGPQGPGARGRPGPG